MKEKWDDFGLRRKNSSQGKRSTRFREGHNRKAGVDKFWKQLRNRYNRRFNNFISKETVQGRYPSDFKR